ncbi:MAG TPA: ABC transporter permease [Thermoanaerobaculia bacterium]|nr:ABC transporter permease [Thermoanaerobaculia bacterium]
MNTLVQDVRYALRGLRKNPVFTVVGVATLAIGIGANAAIFTVIDRVLLSLLPVSRPNELVLLRSPGPSQGHTWTDGDRATSFSYPMYRGLRDRNRAFAGLLAVFPFDASVVERDRAEQARGELVSGNYFDVLGVAPALGRAIVPSDDTAPEAHPVAVLSFDYFRRRFGGNSAVLNKTITVNGRALTVVGVARSGFEGVQRGRPADLFVPITMKASMTPSWNGLDDPKDYWVQMIGRLKEGESLRRAEAMLAATYRSLLAEVAPRLTGWDAGERRRFVDRRIRLVAGGGGRTILQTELAAPLLALMGMVGAVLLIACANLAGLLLARGAARRREHGIRLAVGANRTALFRQTLVESLVIAVIGGAAGVALGSAVVHLLVGALPADADLRRIPMTIDLPVLLFALGASLAAGVLFGLAPALRASRLDPNGVLHGMPDPRGGVLRFRRWLVSGQVALTLALLVGAALFARSLRRLSAVDLGLRPEGIVQFSINPRLTGASPEQTARQARDLTDVLAALPGVRSVSASELGVFQDNDSGGDVSIDGVPAPPGADRQARRDWVGPDYFATLGIPLAAGREFSSRDDAAGAKVAIVNETFARRYLGGRNPIGLRIGFGPSGAPRDTEIVGVARDSRSEVDQEPLPFVFFPYLQDARLRELTFYVRRVGATETAVRDVRALVSRVEPALPPPDVERLRSQIDDSTSRRRLVGTLAMAFAGVAAFLACIGIYGVLAYSVTQRTREIGVRMAVGATAASVRRLVLADVVRFLVAGAAAGVPLAFAVARLIASLLFGVRAADPGAFAAATAAVAAVALVAGYLPARRAARIDPMRALREE